jgi:hypothetical protein
LLEEIVKSEVLCDYVKMGNKADLIIEFHSTRITGVANMNAVKGKYKKNLSACGVFFHDLGAAA